MNCKVCNCDTRNIEQNRLVPEGVPIDVYLCESCVDLMKHDRMNEVWSFNDGQGLYNQEIL
jgi:uncharacterized protein YlaI